MATDIDWSVTEAGFSIEVVIPWDRLVEYEDGTSPEPQTLRHEETIPIPDWIIEARDSAAYRKFWRDRTFEVTQRAHEAAQAVLDKVLAELGLTREETGATVRAQIGEHPALELDDADDAERPE